MHASNLNFIDWEKDFNEKYCFYRYAGGWKEYHRRGNRQDFRIRFCGFGSSDPESGGRYSGTFEKHGIEGFLQIENQVNRDINVKKTVISTGGSVCYCDEALKHMSEHGVIVYIKTDYESLHQRLGDLHQRGVVIRNGSTLLDLYNERTPLYEKYADVVADVSGCRIEKAIDKIKNLLKACAKLYEE